MSACRSHFITDLLLFVMVDDVLVGWTALGECIQLVHVQHVTPQVPQVGRHLKVHKVFTYTEDGQMWNIFVLMSSIYLIIIRLEDAIHFSTRSYFLFTKFRTTSHRYYNYYTDMAWPLNRYITKKKLQN